jgi:hypothetical protein
MVVNLEYHSMLRSHIDTFQGFVFFGVYASQTIVKVEGSEYSVPCVMIKDDSISSDASIVFYSPESDILLAA